MLETKLDRLVSEKAEELPEAMLGTEADEISPGRARCVRRPGRGGHIEPSTTRCQNFRHQYAPFCASTAPTVRRISTTSPSTDQFCT